MEMQKGVIRVKDTFNHRMIAEIAMLLALGIVLKLTTDLVMRTVASFLFVDFLLLITVVILYRHPYLKVAFVLLVVETVVSATLFTLTDMWFVRPIVVLIAFGVIRVVQKKLWKERTKFVWACFLTSKLTIVSVSALFMGVLLINPEILGLSAALSQLGESVLTVEQATFLEENYKVLLASSLFLLAFIYAYIPAFVHLFLGMLIFSALQKVNKRI